MLTVSAQTLLAATVLILLIASLLIAIVFVGLNLASWKWLAPARADFTANGLYTLSNSAKRVVQRLVEPVELELVYSRSVGAETAGSGICCRSWLFRVAVTSSKT